MAEQLPPNHTLLKSLHDIPELQRVPVRVGIVLRPLDTNDATRILEILDADPNIRDRVSVASKMHTEKDVSEQVAAYRNDEHTFRYAITENDKVIGLVSFWRDIDNPFDAPDNPNDYGFGYFLSPNKRGNGIISEAVQQVMDTAVECLNVENFIAYCEKDNADSISVLTKLGFHLTDIELTEQNYGWIEYKYIKEVSPANPSS